MKKQYKNPFEDPEAKLWDKKVKDYKIPKRKKVPLEESIEGYIYVPAIGLYVAKEKTLHDLSWEYTHKKLHKKGLQMLTVRQFIDFILYLKQNKSKIPDAKKVLDEILTKRGPWRAEWLDASFSKKGEQMYINYNHRSIDGELVAKNIEPLEECLVGDCLIDLKSCNKQGLPTKIGNEIIYAPPERGGDVTGWIADSVYEVRLTCRLDTFSDVRQGVRPAFKGGDKK